MEQGPTAMGPVRAETGGLVCTVPWNGWNAWQAEPPPGWSTGAGQATGAAVYGIGSAAGYMGPALGAVGPGLNQQHPILGGMTGTNTGAQRPQTAAHGGPGLMGMANGSGAGADSRNAASGAPSWGPQAGGHPGPWVGQVPQQTGASPWIGTAPPPPMSTGPPQWNQMPTGMPGVGGQGMNRGTPAVGQWGRVGVDPDDGLPMFPPYTPMPDRPRTPAEQGLWDEEVKNAMKAIQNTATKEQWH
mmetsp:Transcript_22612/g.70767  ORF Transcript_22612/g.70767 Transcript_22612/m.70767 type:complete len:244 (-) Transcript_22612:20-751(-)